MKCIVCGHEFELNKENKYVAEKVEYNLIGGNTLKFIECFDCPKCGCQNIANNRVEVVSLCNKKEIEGE